MRGSFLLESFRLGGYTSIRSGGSWTDNRCGVSPCYGVAVNQIYAEYGSEAVGSTCLTTPNPHAAKWTSINTSPTLTDLGVLTGTEGLSSVALAFNNVGDIVGWSETPYPARYSRRSTPAVGTPASGGNTHSYLLVRQGAARTTCPNWSSHQHCGRSRPWPSTGQGWLIQSREVRSD